MCLFSRSCVNSQLPNKCYCIYHPTLSNHFYSMGHSILYIGYYILYFCSPNCTLQYCTLNILNCWICVWEQQVFRTLSLCWLPKTLYWSVQFNGDNVLPVTCCLMTKYHLTQTWDVSYEVFVKVNHLIITLFNWSVVTQNCFWCLRPYLVHHNV